MRKEMFLFLLFSLLIFLSGCILPWEQKEPVSEVSNKGLIIETFKAKDPYLISGSSTKILIEVKNVGGEKAENVILIPPAIEGLSGGEERCPDLNPPIPEKKKEGESCTKEWDFRAPIYSEEVRYSGEGFLATAIYDYTTRANVIIPIFTSDRLNVLRREGKVPEVRPETHNTGAPIHLSYKGPPYLEAETYEGSSEKTYEVTIEFENVDNGRLKTEEGRQKLNEIDFSIPTGAEKYVSVDKGSCANNLELIRDKGSCNFKITVHSGEIKNLPKKELYLDLTIVAKYTYIKEKPSTLVIKPR